MAQNLLDLKFYHYPSGTAVTELKVAQGSTVGQLRAKIEEHFEVTKDCPMVGFSKWHRMVKVGEEKRHVELNNADSAKSLAEVDIEDRSDLFLEGQLVPPGEYDLTTRLLLGQNQRLAYQLETLKGQLEELSQKQLPGKVEHTRWGVGGSNIMLLSIGVLVIFTLVSQNTSLKDGIDRLEEKLVVSLLDSDDSAHLKLDKLQVQVGTLQQQLSTIAATQTKQSDAQEKQQQQLNTVNNRLANVDKSLSTTEQKTAVGKANAVLIKHFNRPLKAVWEALNDKNRDASEIMAIITDRRCGIERRSTPADGEMSGQIYIGGNKGERYINLTPLIMASLAGREDVVKALLVAGAAVNAMENSERTALRMAAIENNPAIIELLVSYGALVNPQRGTPLNDAAGLGNLEAIEMLVSLGANIKREDWGSTPIQLFLKEENKMTNKSQEVKDRIRKLLNY